MFTTELALMVVGLTVAFLSQGHRRTMFHVAIALFLIALSLGSVPLVIGGIAILGMGMIEGSLTNERWLRAKVYATTSVLLLAALGLPAMKAAHDSEKSTLQAKVESPQAVDELFGFDQNELMELVSGNQEFVGALAQEFLGDARRRVAQVASQSDGLDVETTIDFKAPATLLRAVLDHRQFDSAKDLVSHSADQSTNGQLKIHAALQDAKSCNQCHAVGSTPLHAELKYEWNVMDEPKSSDRETIALDPELMVHAN